MWARTINCKSIWPGLISYVLMLAAYLASLQYDVAAITESFLNDSITHSLVVLLYLHHMLDIILSVTGMVEEYLL